MRNVLLVTILMLFLMAPISSAAEFSDLPPGHWVYDAVVKLQEAGIIVPFPDGEFKGETLVTRYDVALYIDRTIDYLVSNVEYMNHQQAALLSELLKELVSEFRTELIMLSLDIRDLERKLDEVRRVSMWRFGVETEAFVNLSRLEETIAGGTTTVTDENSFGVSVSTALSGQTERYFVDVWAKALVFRPTAIDDMKVALDGFRLEATNNDGFSVRLGDLKTSSYNDYLLADVEDGDLWGVHVATSNGFALFNEGLEFAYAVPAEPQTTSDTTDFALARFSHRAGNVEFDLYGGLRMNDVAFNDPVDVILGLDGTLISGPFTFDVGIASQSLETMYRMVSVGMEISEAVRTSVTYTNVDDEFDGLYSDLNKGQRLSGRVELDSSDKITFYGEVASQLPFGGQNPTFELGVETEGIQLANLATLDTRLSYNTDKGIGGDTTVHFDEHNNVRLFGTLPLETDGAYEAGVKATGRVGMFQVEAGYENNESGETRKSITSAGLGFYLNEDTKLRFSWEDRRENDTASNGTESKETVTGLSLTFSF